MKIIAKTPDLWRLQRFLAVAETLNFGRAASALGISQPPLSLQIQKLEREVGHPLFNRGASGRSRIQLTDAGRALVAPAKRAITAAENAMEGARFAGSLAAARLRMPCWP